MATPRRFGDYELLAALGAGGMGQVFRARASGDPRDVALKLPTTDRLLDAKRLARFEREGRITASLRHPHIVPVHAAGVIDGRPFLAYELIAGAHPLDEAFRTRDLRERVRLVRDATLGLAHAHAHGVVHRDVKPDNVLVDTDGRVTVADFGLATALGEDRLTRTGAMMGTPLYMAPEVVLEGGAAIGAPADVYALGVLLYQALTGKHPFEDQGLQALVAPDSRRIASPSKLVRDTPPALERLCLRALSLDPATRPTAQAFGETLDAWLEGRLTARSPVRWLVGALTVTLLTAAGAAQLTSRPDPGTSGALPSSPSASTSPSPSATPPTPDPAAAETAARRRQGLSLALELATAPGPDHERLIATLEPLATTADAPEPFPELAAQVAQAVLDLQTGTDPATTDRETRLAEALGLARCRPRDRDQVRVVDGLATLATSGLVSDEHVQRCALALTRLDVRLPRTLFAFVRDPTEARRALRDTSLSAAERFFHLRVIWEQEHSARPELTPELLALGRSDALGPTARAWALVLGDRRRAPSERLTPEIERDITLAHALDPERVIVLANWADLLLQRGDLEAGWTATRAAWETWCSQRKRLTQRYLDGRRLRVAVSNLLTAGCADWAEALLAQALEADGFRVGAADAVALCQDWIASSRAGTWPQQAAQEQSR